MVGIRTPSESGYALFTDNPVNVVEHCLQASVKVRIKSGFLEVHRLYSLGPVHRTPEKFGNAALFLRLGVPSTLIRHENGAFGKRSSNWRNSKTPELFENVDVTIIVISLPKLFSNINSKITGVCCVFEFLWRNVDGKHEIRFRS